MAKLVVLKLDGTLEQGFRVALEIGSEGEYPKTEITGHLPPAAELVANYSNWQSTYRSLGSFDRAITAKKITYDGSLKQRRKECRNLAQLLRSRLNRWLSSESFRPLREKWLEKLSTSEEVRVLIRTSDVQLRQLPWHLWDFLFRYPTAEIALSTPEYDSPIRRRLTRPNQIRILAILGNSEGINVQKDRKLLEKLPGAATTILVEPKYQELNDQLWEQSWDLLFFAGHSQREGEKGRIYLNQTDSFTIDELSEALKKAVEGGLQLAIFNSCDGLGLARELEQLNIPQIIVMGEPVPDRVAQEFLKYFLTGLARGQSLYQAVREARKKLQGLEDKYPCASWLPIICQNPAVVPPTWQQLGGLLPCPYRGLSTFGEEDTPFFKGRETFTDQLVEAVKRKPLVAVIGASGSGKSSVVLAGLIPHLRSRAPVQVVYFRPGQSPFEALATALAPLLHQGENHQGLTKLELTTALRQDAHSLYKIIESIVQQNPSTRLVLVADQFEELFTLCSEEDCYPFLDRLLHGVNQAATFTLVLTLRADFFGRALSYPPLGKALQDYPPELLISMNRSELERAIALPAAAINVQLEKGLTQRLIDEVGSEAGRLPLLEFTLTQLWSKQKDGLLTHQAYEEIGGVEEALALHAEAVYAQMSESDRLRAQRVFVQLVCPGEGTEDIRRLATRDQIKEENWDLVTRLANARLVVTNRNDSTGAETVEIVHEVLIKSWGHLAQWMRVRGEFRRWQEQLRVVLRQWESSGCDDDALLRGKLLTDALYWRQKDPDSLGASEQAFIQLSREQRDSQIKQEKHRVVVLRSLLGLVSGALVVAVGVGLVAVKQSWKAERQTAIKKAILVKSLLPTKPLKGLVQAIEATGSSQSLFSGVPEEVQSSLLEAIQVAREGTIERNILRGHEGLVSSIAISPDGQYIVSGSFDKTVRLWDKQGHPIGRPFRGHEDKVRSVAFSPDGKYIASGSDDKTVRLWDREGQPIGQPFRGHEKPVFSVAFSPDGQYIASGSFDKTVRLWDREGQPIGQPFRGHEDFVISVAFSPDGQYIASGSDDKTVRLWDRQGQPIGQPFQGHEDFVASVAFSPDGKYIASGSFDKTVRLWDKQGNPIGQPFQGHQDVVYSVAFSPDGKYIASGSFDTTVRLWDRQGQPLSQTFRGHDGEIRAVAFSPNGQTIISSSGDKTVRLWDRQGYQPFQGHQDVVASVAFSPDGKHIASGSFDKTVRLWDRQGNPIGQPFRGHEDRVRAVAFSPDGKYIASGSFDKTVRLWDRQGNPIGQPFQGHQDVVLSVAFSPDGQTIISSSDDKTVRLWDRQGNPIGQPFRGHQDVVLSVAFSPDGKYIASGSFDTTVRLWDRQGNPIGQPFRGHKGFVTSVAFSPDGKYIASGSFDTTVRLWDRQGHPLGQSFRGHEDKVRAVAFSPDGKYIASGSDDKTVRLWDKQGQPIGQPFWGHDKPIRSIVFSSDGQYIVSSSDDKTVRLWDREGNWQTWLQVACNRLRSHSVLTNPQTDEEKEARETCQDALL